MLPIRGEVTVDTDMRIFLVHDRPYAVLYELWSFGSQKVLLWGGADYARQFATSTHLGGSRDSRSSRHFRSEDSAIGQAELGTYLRTANSNTRSGSSNVTGPST